MHGFVKDVRARLHTSKEGTMQAAGQEHALTNEQTDERTTERSGGSILGPDLPREEPQPSQVPRRQYAKKK